MDLHKDRAGHWFHKTLGLQKVSKKPRRQDAHSARGAGSIGDNR